MSSLAVLEATNMVGQTVDVQASSIALEQDGSVSGMVNLGEAADSVTVQLYNQEGELVEEKQLPYSESVRCVLNLKPRSRCVCSESVCHYSRGTKAA